MDKATQRHPSSPPSAVSSPNHSPVPCSFGLASVNLKKEDGRFIEGFEWIIAGVLCENKEGS